MDFEGRTAVVVGAGRDIGRACAIRLAEGGANIVINYHSSSTGALSAVDEITAGGGRAIAVQGDMTKPDDVAQLVSSAVERFGKTIDVLVHVAGGLIARRTLEELDLEHWHAVHDVNLTSLFLTTKAVLPHLAVGGAIVTFASQAGRDGGGPGALAYASSKGAVMSYTRALAKDLGPRIRVNAICPGMIDTGFHDTFTAPQVRENVARATPLKREGTSRDVAELAAYLASDRAAFMTGACIDINGGTLFS